MILQAIVLGLAMHGATVTTQATTSTTGATLNMIVTAQVVDIPNMAVLTGFPWSSFTPQPNVTYYFGTISEPTDAQVSGNAPLFVPCTGNIKAATFDIINRNGTGSAEMSSVFIRINSTSDVIVSDRVQANATFSRAKNTALDVPVVVGDSLELKWLTPVAWQQQPTGIRISLTVGVACQ